MNRLTYRDENGKAWTHLRQGCTTEEQMRYGRESLEKLATYEDAEESGELVSVVRCKDCTEFKKGKCYNDTDEYNQYLIYRSENDFCSCGIRRVKE